MKEKFYEFIRIIRPKISGLFLILFIFFGKPKTLYWIIIGSVIAFLGLVIRVWAAGCIEKNKFVCTRGPYAFVRHPLYVGNFLFGVGLCVSITDFSNFWMYFWAFFIFLFLGVFYPLILSEEAFLEKNFPEQFLEYKKKLKRFIPTFKTKYSPKFFSLRLFFYNQEHWRILFYIVFVGWLVFRYYLDI